MSVRVGSPSGNFIEIVLMAELITADQCRGIDRCYRYRNVQQPSERFSALTSTSS
jgi:hypothetical protein